VAISADRLRSSLDGRHVTVTGGCSFIGSHLTDALVGLGAHVRVIDDLSSGRWDNVAHLADEIDFRQVDIAGPDFTPDLLAGQDTVFHLAAVHGGRGYLASHPVECLTNLAIDNRAMEAAMRTGVCCFVYASSASVYPIGEPDRWVHGLPEDAADLTGPVPPAPDGPYGWSKLVGEYQLSVMAANSDMNGVVCRIFNTYGERSGPGHVVRSLVTKALARLDPYPVWGDGSQTRGFTYVHDVVKGLVLCSGLPGAAVVNLGSPEPVSVSRVMSEIFDLVGWTPAVIDHEMDKPEGPGGRVASSQRCLEVLGWCPSTPLAAGLERTIAWCRDSFS
jgi:nucleoside-diphosphate-sugar epimerase